MKKSRFSIKKVVMLAVIAALGVNASAANAAMLLDKAIFKGYPHIYAYCKDKGYTDYVTNRDGTYSCVKKNILGKATTIMTPSMSTVCKWSHGDRVSLYKNKGCYLP